MLSTVRHLGRRRRDSSKDVLKFVEIHIQNSFIKSISTGWSSFSKSWYSKSSYIPSWVFENETESENEYAGLSMSYFSEQPKDPWYTRLWRQNIYPFLYYIRYERPFKVILGKVKHFSEPKRVVSVVGLVLLAIAGYHVYDWAWDKTHPPPAKGFLYGKTVNGSIKHFQKF